MWQDPRYPPAPVVVIGYDFRQRTFNGDPRILRRPLRVSRRGAGVDPLEALRCQ